MTDNDPEFRLLWWQHLNEQMKEADKNNKPMRTLADYIIKQDLNDADEKTVEFLRLFIEAYAGTLQAQLIYVKQIDELHGYIKELRKDLNGQ